MKTVAITPATAYVNGKQMTATKLNVVSVKDDLFSNVTFKYTLFNDEGEFAGEAAYKLKGIEQYSKWDASADEAYNIVAAGIGLEIAPNVNGSIFNEVA